MLQRKVRAAENRIIPAILANQGERGEEPVEKHFVTVLPEMPMEE
jgi:hypothetical protein